MICRTLSNNILKTTILLIILISYTGTSKADNKQQVPETSQDVQAAVDDAYKQRFMNAMHKCGPAFMTCSSISSSEPIKQECQERLTRCLHNTMNNQ